MKTLVIGCGGIGSHLIGHINKAYETAQIPPHIEVDIADFDSVEMKNILFQNFTEDEVMENKAKALKKRYEYIRKAIPEKINNSHLKNYDCFIICADNFEIRKEIIEYCHNSNKFFIDLRAEGKQVFSLYKGYKPDDMSTLNLNDKESGSCQKGDRINYGYLVAAAIGIQLFIDCIRGNLTARNRQLLYL